VWRGNKEGGIKTARDGKGTGEERKGREREEGK